MAQSMTKHEAEAILGLTEAYTLADLETAHRRHMATYHPDKFHMGSKGSGGMTEEEATAMFVSGSHAYECLLPLFNGAPEGHKVTPSSASQQSQADYDTTSHRTEDQPHEDAWAQGAQSEWASSRPYDAWYRDVWGDPEDDHGNTGSEDGEPKKSKSHKHKKKKKKEAGKRQRQYAYHAEPSPADFYNAPRDGGGVLFWLVALGIPIWLALLSRSDPSAAFDIVAGVITNPLKLSLLIGGLWILYATGK